MTHGDSLIVEEIRDRYLGKVDVTTMVTLNSVQTRLGGHPRQRQHGLYAGYPERL